VKLFASVGMNPEQDERSNDGSGHQANEEEGNRSAHILLLGPRVIWKCDIGRLRVGLG
jgi:hypothetical protein